MAVSKIVFFDTFSVRYGAETGLKQVNQLVRERTSNSLSAVEITVLKGSWLSYTYEAIADITNYSASYLSRICPFVMAVLIHCFWWIGYREDFSSL